MDLQQLTVALIVAGSSAYAAWALMPASWRQGLMRCMPSRLAKRLAARQAAAGSGCGGCAGCDGAGRSAAPARADGLKPVLIHRPPGRRRDAP